MDELVKRAGVVIVSVKIIGAKDVRLLWRACRQFSLLGISDMARPTGTRKLISANFISLDVIKDSA